MNVFGMGDVIYGDNQKLLPKRRAILPAGFFCIYREALPPGFHAFLFDLEFLEHRV